MSELTFRLGSRAGLLHPGSLHESLHLLSESCYTPDVALYALRGVYTNIQVLVSVCTNKSNSGTLTVCCVPFPRLTGLFLPSPPFLHSQMQPHLPVFILCFHPLSKCNDRSRYLELTIWSRNEDFSKGYRFQPIPAAAGAECIRDQKNKRWYSNTHKCTSVNTSVMRLSLCSHKSKVRSRLRVSTCSEHSH